MKTWVKALIGISLSFMVLFTSIGFAQVTNILSVLGNANATVPEEIFITSVELVDSSSVNSQTASYKFPRNLDTVLNFSARYGYFKYKVTLHNNTPYKYAYSSIDYESDLSGYDNSYINNYISITLADENNGTLNGNDVIESGGDMVIYITYTLTNRNHRNTDIKNLINIKFGVNVDSVGTQAIDKALDKFQNVLNDTSDGGGYKTLIDRIDDKFNGEEWSSNYIGNVVDSSSEDTATINQLFQGELKLTIDNVESNVTVLIKRENIDNNKNTGDDYTATNGYTSFSAQGCEMTLYMTTDTLQNRNSDPVIYAVVFTCDKNSDGSLGPWYMIGDMYVGTADIVGYEGGEYTGSFDTGTWRSTGTTNYKATSTYSYTVYRNSTIQSIVQVMADNSSLNIFSSQLNEANRLISDGSYAGGAMIALETAFANAARCYTVGDDGSITLKSGLTRAQIVPLMKELENALEPF